jgi:serine/threonine-protein kinase
MLTVRSMRAGVVVASKYRLVRQLGAGGMGSVWQAVHVVTERDFAIKFLHASCAKSPGLLQRFFQEARVSGKLRHPSVIEIFDVGTAPELEGAPYLVMELLEGASLDGIVRAGGPMPARLVLETIGEAARALAMAHDKGIVHRDLKPANIFLHRPGTGALVPKVLDFGISKIATAGPEVTGLTQTGAVLGSPLYMSPEQAASDKSIDGRSDVHALGVVMWECLVGDPPFLADTYNNLVVQIITGARPRLRDALPAASDAVVAIVERAMARVREERFQSAGELAAAIDDAVAVMPPPSSLTSRTAAADLFARLGPPPVRPDIAAAETVSSTTGGVAVPSARGAAAGAPGPQPAQGPREGRSPVAMSVADPTSSPLAFEDTHRAPPGSAPRSTPRPAAGAPLAAPTATTLAVTAEQPPLAAHATSGAGTLDASGPRPRVPLVAWVAAAALVATAAVAVPLALRRAVPAAATGGAREALVPASAVAAPAEPAAHETSSTEPTPAPSASTAVATVTSARSAPAPSARWAPPAVVPRAGPAKPPAKRPEDSVETSGFR